MPENKIESDENTIDEKVQPTENMTKNPLVENKQNEQEAEQTS